MQYCGGIEGGATHSTCIICDENGKCISTTKGLGTNHWQVGMDVTVSRIADMVQRAKESAGISNDTPLDVLGLSLSGCRKGDEQQELKELLSSGYPNLAKSYVVTEDTMGAVYTASANGGMVLISGTGSNAFLINVDGSTHNCGGWGHFIGDEGSAFHISHRAVKIVFDDIDGLRKSPYPIEDIWNILKEYFKIENRADMLTHFYQNFDKPFFARLCIKLADAATEGNLLAQSIFEEAGENLGTMAAALLSKIQPDSIKSNTANIICVGSVWLSFPLLQEGFRKGLQKANVTFDVNLIRLNKSTAFGACYHAADTKKFDLPRNYTDNFDILVQYSYESECYCNLNE